MTVLASFRHMAAALLLALLPIVVSMGAANAQTIENTANATWEFQGATASASSNTVLVEVQALPPEIRTYTAVPNGGHQFTFTSPRCLGSPGGTAGTSSAEAPAVTLSASPTHVVQAGQDIIFEVIAAAANINPNAVDRLTATIETSLGDREQLEIYETGADTGVFIGRIASRRVPPAPVRGDCVLSVNNGVSLTIGVSTLGSTNFIVTTNVEILADPFGVVFDSETGEPVSGAVVTLIDVATGQPARVFAEDGVTVWPSTLVSGSPITDAAGNTYPMGPGEYWFPLTFLGTYRLEITPPAPYTAPSVASRDDIAVLTRPDGRPFVIADASFGGTLTLVDATPVQIDIPLDRPSLEISLSKTASRQRVQPGDAVFYTITARNTDPTRVKRNVVLVDQPSRWLRLRPDSIRVDGVAAPAAISISADGSRLEIQLGDLPAGASRRVTYAMVVRADATPGQAVNRATATDSLGRVAIARATINVDRDTIAGRMTIIGRVTAGSCALHDDRIGIPGVRVMMEDGSFAVTDRDGRYHFEGVVPGTHVVQAARMTLPEGGEFVDCTRSTRSAGSATSQFVTGQGGTLAEADFHAVLPPEALEKLTAALAQAQSSAENPLESGEIKSENGEPVAPQDAGKAAAVTDTDWLALGDGDDGWLSPAINHNPRAPVVNVAIRHRKGQTINLFANGKPVDALAFEGMRSATTGKYAVSTWRGVPLASERTVLKAEIVNSFGVVNSSIEREVFFVSTPARAEIVADQSTLVADGVTKPVLAVRILDRNGRPVRGGVAGEFTLNEPFQSASQLEMQQMSQLTGSAPASARWVIEGEDGIAKIELAPTLVSGSLRLEFQFTDEKITRKQMVEAWVTPGDVEWTIVGLAEGSVGAQTVADNMERAGRFDSDLGDEARVALYAKGRILGKYLLTLAYDSAKQREDQRALGALDPDAYYTVFADGSSRRFDAASREKLYVRIETATFFAIYGDYETGFDQTQLARYNRTATGVKAEARLGQVNARGFVAKIGSRFRRDEIQGNGLSGPYRLGSRDIVANSEQITLEVRDRLRSESIVSSRVLTRFIDYDIDVLSGTISFSQPITSRDFDFNPQFIVAEYEVSSLAGGEWNAGLRTDWTNKDGSIRIGATAISDKGDATRTNVGGLDLRARVAQTTEIRAELALSEQDGATSAGWLVEAQHQSGKTDFLAYARSLDAGYGVGQQSGAETGRRKFGIDARHELSEQFSILGSIWQDDSLSDIGRRRAAQAQFAYRTQSTDLRLGLAHFADRLANGTHNSSTVLEAGATQRLLENRLELSASTSLALDDAASVDLPSRHRVDARFAVTPDVKLVGTYEIADGKNIEARTLRAGVEVSPWQGGRVVSTLGQQDIGEFGNRSFAAFGLAQTIQVNSQLSLDATIDGNRTLGGNPGIASVINPAQPVASGGQINQDGSLFEDFTAVTLGGSWRHNRWSATGRAEYRDGEFADRKGLTLGAIRQLGEGSVVGAGFTWTQAEGSTGTSSEIMDGAIAFAHRPDESEIAVLGKLEFRSDEVRGAVAGETGPAGRTALLVNGDAQSRRLIASVSTNWTPEGEDDDGNMTRRDEFGLFVGARYNFDRFEGFDLAGTTFLAGADARIGIGERFEIGASATVRANIDDKVTSFSYGPNIGFVPADGVLLSVGYNVAGFRDDDFSAARNTDKGVYAAVRMKFDADSFGSLGLGR